MSKDQAYYFTLPETSDREEGIISGGGTVPKPRDGFFRHSGRLAARLRDAPVLPCREKGETRADISL
jgi:hypothetical protein